jgi:hypothetical protein
VVWIRRIVPSGNQPLHVAGFVHDLTLLIREEVSDQIDGLVAAQAGELTFFRAMGFSQISLVSFYGATIPRLYGNVPFDAGSFNIAGAEIRGWCGTAREILVQNLPLSLRYLWPGGWITCFLRVCSKRQDVALLVNGLSVFVCLGGFKFHGFIAEGADWESLWVVHHAKSYKSEPCACLPGSALSHFRTFFFFWSS